MALDISLTKGEIGRKTMNKFTFLFFVCLIFNLDSSLYAQSEKLYIADRELSEIEGPWLVMQLYCRARETNVLVFYGQKCIRGIGIVYNEKELASCVALKDASGTLIDLTHYTEALNLMEQHGFTLSVINPRENYESEATKFIFRKGEHEPITIDRKRANP